MSLVPMTLLLKKAEEGNYAIGAFNISNVETIQAVIKAGEEEKSPLILQAARVEIEHGGIECLTAMAKALIDKATIPIALHLDHGDSFSLAMKCIRYGFTSVMFDGSTMPLEDNISITKKIVEAAKAVGVSVEAELGQVGRTEDEILEEDWEKFLTDPDVAATFVQETKVDALAVSIGSLHGLYRFEPKLDFSRLKRIRELIEVPIVLHGGTGIPDLDIKKAISLGIRKVNFSTGLRAAYIGQLRDFLIENRDELNLQRVLGSARQKMKEVVKEMIRLVGSDGKADISTSERSIFETA